MACAPAHTPEPRNRHRINKILAACVLVGLSATLLIWIDHLLKASSTLGYRPENATWTIATGNFSASWRGFEETGVVQTLRAETPFPIDDLILSGRQATGVRLTPARWRTYLGHRFVASASPDGFGWSTRPGLLLRGLSLAHSTFIARSLGDGLYSFGDFAYSRHKGFLLVSRSTEYLRAAREANVLPMDAEVPFAGFSLNKTGASEWTMIVSAEEGLPVAGTVAIALAPRKAPLTLTHSWPESPMVAITGSNPRQCINAIVSLLEGVPGSERLTGSMAEMGFMLPRYTDKHGAEFSLAVLDVDTSQTLAVPEVALVVRGVKPRFSVMAPFQSIPFEWNGNPGWIRPWLGEKLGVCWTVDDQLLYYTNQQSVMARTVGRMETATPSSAHLELAIDWARVSRVGTDLVRVAAKHELLPRMNAADAEDLVVPYMRSLAQFGALHVECKSDGSSVRFEGHLAATKEGLAATEYESAS